MGVSYKKLWMLIIEKDLKKSEVREMAKISASTFSKMAKNEYVSLDILIRLCIALECEIRDYSMITFRYLCQCSILPDNELITWRLIIILGGRLKWK